MADPITFVTVDRTTKLPATPTTDAILGKVNEDLLAPEHLAVVQLVGAVRALVTGASGLVNLNALHTTAKSSIIAAVNEVFDLLDNIDASSLIDDSQAIESKTYSSKKVAELLASVRSDLIGGADASHNTLGKLTAIIALLRTDTDNKVSTSALTTTLQTKADLVAGKVPINQLPDFAPGEGGSYPPAGGVPRSDLTPDVRTALTTGESAYQKPSGGITTADLAPAVTTSLGKADSAVQPAALTTGLAGKVDTSTLSGYATVANLNTKASSADLTNGLATKADSSAVTSALSFKADATAMTTALNLKADASAVAAKANTTDVNSALATKADSSTMTTALAGKASTASVTTLTTAVQGAPTVRVQGSDGTYPSVGSAIAGQVIFYIGPTPPDPAIARQPALYIKGTIA